MRVCVVESTFSNSRNRLLPLLQEAVATNSVGEEGDDGERERLSAVDSQSVYSTNPIALVIVCVGGVDVWWCNSSRVVTVIIAVLIFVVAHNARVV